MADLPSVPRSIRKARSGRRCSQNHRKRGSVFKTKPVLADSLVKKIINMLLRLISPPQRPQLALHWATAVKQVFDRFTLISMILYFNSFLAFPLNQSYLLVIGQIDPINFTCILWFVKCTKCPFAYKNCCQYANYIRVFPQE